MCLNHRSLFAVAEYHEAFNLFDKDGNGQVTKQELKAVLLTLGKNPTDEEVQEMITSVDSNGKNSSGALLELCCFIK